MTLRAREGMRVARGHGLREERTHSPPGGNSLGPLSKCSRKLLERHEHPRQDHVARDQAARRRVAIQDKHEAGGYHGAGHGAAQGSGHGGYRPAAQLRTGAGRECLVLGALPAAGERGQHAHRDDGLGPPYRPDNIAEALGRGLIRFPHVRPRH